MRKVMTTAVLAKAKQMKLDGIPINKIAAELDVNYHTIREYLSDIKSPLKSAVSEEKKQEILRLSKTGLSTYKIADEVDLPQSTVYSFLKKAKKEPASSANNASSKVSDVSSECASSALCIDYNRMKEKCQVTLKETKQEISVIYNSRLSGFEQNVFDLGELYCNVDEDAKIQLNNRVYNYLSESLQHAWDLGELYYRVCRFLEVIDIYE
jgi:orotate phosphoribosyltransferase-like protein